METKVNGFGGIRVTAALIGLSCVASFAGAQRAPPNDLPNPRVRAASCAEVSWDKELLGRYPRIAEGCQEVFTSEGRKWARFEAGLVRSNRDGSVTLDFKNRQGRSIEELTVQPAPEQRVSIDGRSYRFSDLERNQRLNVYVPEGMFALATTPGAPAEQLAVIVTTPVPVGQEPPVLPQSAAAPLLAQVEPTPRTAAQVLPSTAGPLPLFALAGLLALLGGLGLTIRRRLFS